MSDDNNLTNCQDLFEHDLILNYGISAMILYVLTSAKCTRPARIVSLAILLFTFLAEFIVNAKIRHIPMFKKNCDTHCNAQLIQFFRFFMCLVCFCASSYKIIMAVQVEEVACKTPVKSSHKRRKYC